MDMNIGQSVAKYMSDDNNIQYYAQELKENTYNLTRMNLVMRGIDPANIITRNGDTLEEDWPYFDENDPVNTYNPLYVDAVVSNPPYSQAWDPSNKEGDPRYARFGLAPKGKADYAFLLHDLFHIKPDGIMTIVLPHGVLFRGGEEGEIRKNLIENNHIDAIIGLPANIFFGTGIPTIIMVLRQKRENTDVLIIDASKGFIKEGKNNKLRASDIKRIADTFIKRESVPKFSRVATMFSPRKAMLPLLEEQRKIGKLFDTLDNLITLHQRKFEKLTNVKKSMLEKMFPQNGSSYPEIRFKGFTDPWEQRKLGDIGKARSGVGFPDADQGGLTGVPFFKVSDMNSDGNENEMTVANNYVTAEQIADHRWSPITELPAIFFAKVGAAVMLNRKRLCRFPFLLDNNTMAYSLSPTKWDADFAKALFGTVDLTSLVQVGALPSYNAGDVESMEIYLPSLLEQEQIGAYFNHLDNLITLHQRELEKLQNIKKSMLEKMFV